MKLLLQISKLLFWPLWIIAGVLLLYISFKSEGSIGGSDDLMHYKIAHFAFKYPHLLLHHWGKPVFTLLIAPFAQIGMIGMRVFNVFAMLVTLILGKSLLKSWGVKDYFFYIPMVLFAPIYYNSVPTALTEILFGTWIILCIALAQKKKLLLATILLSFIILIRNEGFLFWIPWTAFLIYNKQYKTIPFLLFGFITYSIIGGLYFDDFLWLIHQMPYGDATGIYGKGKFLHFIDAQKDISGITLTLLFFAGFILLCYKTIYKKSFNYTQQIMFLSFLCASAYFVGHSYSWWSGKGSSLGLLRVMSAIIPLMALIGMLAAQEVLNLAKQISPSLKIVLMGVLFIGLFKPWYTEAIKYYPEEQGAKSTRNALKHYAKDHSISGKIFYMHPGISQYLDFDPYDKSKSLQYFGMSNPDNIVSEGDFIIWDGHHSPMEGKLQLHTLMDSFSYKLLGYYTCDYYFEVASGKPWEMYLFEKIKPWKKLDNYHIKDSLIHHLNNTIPNDSIVDTSLFNIKSDSKNIFYNLNCDNVKIEGHWKLVLELNIESDFDGEVSFLLEEEGPQGFYDRNKAIQIKKGKHNYTINYCPDSRNCNNYQYRFSINSSIPLKEVNYQIIARDRIVN